MNSTTVISLIGFGPAIFLLYFVLGEYEGYFKDNKAFFMIILGLGVGMVVGTLSLYFPLGDFLWTLGIISLIELIKFLIFLQKPFRLNHDTTFYGMALGIGIAAMMFFVYGYSAGLTELSAKTTFFVLLLSLNYNLLHGSTGAIIGYGVYKGEFWRYFFRAFILSGIHGFLMSIVWRGKISDTGSIALLIIGCIYGVILTLYIYKDIFPKTVPKEMKRAKERLE